MISGQLLSCSVLLLTTGCRFLVIGKELTNNYSKLRPEFIAAAIGVLAINARATCNYLTPFFINQTRGPGGVFQSKITNTYIFFFLIQNFVRI